MTRIDMIVAKLQGGGAEHMALCLAAALARRGYGVRIVTGAGQDSSRVPRGVAVCGAFTLDGGTGAIRRLHAFARCFGGAERPDLVIAVQANMAIEAAFASLMVPVRIIGWEHNIPSRAVRGRIWRALRPLAYRRLAALVALHGSSADALRKVVRVPVSVIPNFLVAPVGEQRKSGLSVEALPEGRKIILAVGRLVPAKGFDNLIRAFAHLVASREDTLLVILGEGPERAALEGLVAAYGVQDRVILGGVTAPVSPFYVRADCFVLTSRWEGMPMVLLEAMAAGVPVVTTDFGPVVTDLVQHGEDGFVVAQDDMAGWCAAVSHCLDAGPEVTRMRAAARAKAALYHEDVVLDAWLQLIADVAPAPAPEQAPAGAAGPGAGPSAASPALR